MSSQNGNSRRPQTVGLIAWSQILGVGGAFTLANMLKEFYFWKDFLLGVFEGWSGFVEQWIWPVVAFLFGWTFDLLTIELTPFWKNYLTFGSILGLGFFRHFIILNLRMKEVGAPESEYFQNRPVIPLFPSPWQKFSPLLFFSLSPLFWPLTIFVFIVTLTLSKELKRFIIYSVSSVILPFYYLLLLIGFNEIY